MHATEEEQERIASLFLNDAELRLERLPGTLQELIDALPDHNQQMLDAIESVDEDLYGAVGAALDDGDDDDRKACFDLVNALFARVERMLSRP